jgi:hypothetical protein
MSHSVNIWQMRLRLRASGCMLIPICTRAAALSSDEFASSGPAFRLLHPQFTRVKSCLNKGGQELVEIPESITVGSRFSATLIGFQHADPNTTRILVGRLVPALFKHLFSR